MVEEEISLKDIHYLQRWGPAEPLCNFGRWQFGGHICEVILNLDQWFRRCRLKMFLIYSFGDLLVQQSGTICANLVEGIMRNNLLQNYFEFGPVVQKKMSFKKFRQIWRPLYSGQEPFGRFW